MPFPIITSIYDGDGYEVLVHDHGWEEVSWKARGGYGNRTAAGQKNRARERLFFSPHCLRPGADRPVQQGLIFDGESQE